MTGVTEAVLLRVVRVEEVCVLGCLLLLVCQRYARHIAVNKIRT